jgi:hypothetical protein
MVDGRRVLVRERERGWEGVEREKKNEGLNVLFVRQWNVHKK